MVSGFFQGRVNLTTEMKSTDCLCDDLTLNTKKKNILDFRKGRTQLLSLAVKKAWYSIHSLRKLRKNNQQKLLVMFFGPATESILFGTASQYSVQEAQRQTEEILTE